jgi:hypothetical protein
MADTMRWRYGDTNPVVATVAPDTVIEIGDLVWLGSNQALPAGHDSDGDGNADLWDTNLATTQSAFHSLFLGVAMQRSRSGDAEPIRVATTGVFEMDCASAAFALGELVGPARQGSNNRLANQTVVAVEGGSEHRAVGRVARSVDSPATRVLVDIQSTILRGGPQRPELQ